MNLARAAAAISVGFILMTCGCRSDQQADVASYRAISDPPGALPALAPGAELPLRSAMLLTAAYNEQLAVQGERWVQALADRQRLAAALRPTVDLFARTDVRENTGKSGVVQTDVGVSGQYRLLTGMSDLRSVRSADARIDSARWLILDLRESLLVQVARAYYDALRAERLVVVLENSEGAQTARLSDARARNDAGFTRSLDVAQIDAQVSRTRAQLIDAKRQAGEARSLLALLTNAPANSAVLVDGYTVPMPPPEIEKMYALAVDNRQDVRAARAEAEAARQLVDAAIGQYAPSLVINLDYFLLRSPDVDLSSIASVLELRVPIFSAGRIEAEVRSSWSVFRERVLEYRARRRAARSDVETAHLRLIAAVQLAGELLTQVRVATQTVELAEATYQAGLGTNLERIVAQDQLLAAELEAVSAEFSTKTAYLELLRASGVLSSELAGTPLPEPVRESEPRSPFLDRGSAPEPPAIVVPTGATT